MRNKAVFLLVIFLSLLVLGSCAGKKKRPHILLITIDTLRRDHLGVYGYHRDTSPFIDQLAKKGLMFKHVITPEPLTAPNHASILTSLHPLSHHLTMNGMRLNKNVSTIARVLRENGYYTIGTVGVKILKGKFGFSRGFDSFSDSWDENVDFNTENQRTAPSINKSLFHQVGQYLDNADNTGKPLFMWIHYFDPHSPYHGRDHIEFETAGKEDKKSRTIRRYDEEIRFTDQHIAELYRFLEKKGIGENLVSCITSDHGEQLGEHGRFAKHVDIYSESFLVPLIFHGPGIPKGKTIDTYVSSLDIGVTLLRLLNLEYPHYADGIDLLNIKKNQENRKFLVIGNPLYARSLEMIGPPYSFILNFDWHYTHWFISGSNAIPEDRFTAFPMERVKIKGNEAVIPLPHSWARGLNYLALRADIKPEANCRVNIKVRPSLRTGFQNVPAGIKQLNVIYPITTVDGLVATLRFKQGVPLEKLANVRYAVISRKELPAAGVKQKTIDNTIYKYLMTPRKNTSIDELYDLSTDTAMERNMIGRKDLKATVIEFKKLIYASFKYYFLKKNQVLKGSKTKTELTPKEKEMLKSLGYL